MGTMSQDYGCCHVGLTETAEESWFTFEPVLSISSTGQVINFNDFFFLKAAKPVTPFFLHVFCKPNDTFTDQKAFLINAGQEPSPLKAKLFMQFHS